MKTYTVNTSTLTYKFISQANFDNLDRACEYAAEQIDNLFTAEEFKTPIEEHGAIAYQNRDTNRFVVVVTD